MSDNVVVRREPLRALRALADEYTDYITGPAKEHNAEYRNQMRARYLDMICAIIITNTDVFEEDE